MANNIILIGFMGVGKGRTARELARLTGRFAVDTDDLIESLTNTRIRKIFRDQGEEAFRLMEKNLALWLGENVSNTVVSTGGGFFMVDGIEKLGDVVYLHAPVEYTLATLLARPNSEKQIKKRPLLNDLPRAKQLFAQRLPLYRRAAKIEVNVAGGDISSVAREIQELLQL